MAYVAAFIRRPAADVSFDRIESADPIQRFSRNRGGVRDLDVVELAAHVGPTGGLLDALAVQALKARVAVCLSRVNLGDKARQSG